MPGKNRSMQKKMSKKTSKNGMNKFQEMIEKKKAGKKKANKK
jgi:hypothetical protein